MAKRVLGNDPFAPGGGGDEPTDPSGRASGTAKGAATKKGAKPSVRPTARSTPSKRPSGGARPAKSVEARADDDARSEPDRDESSGIGPQDQDEAFEVPSAPRVPSDTLDVADDALGDHDESGAPADPPPEHAVEQDEIVPERIAAGSAGEVQAEIRDLEAELDRLLGQVSEKGVGRETLDRVAEKLRAKMSSSSMPPAPERTPRDEQHVFDVARELLSSDYYLRQWGKVAMRDRSEEVDEFGLDPKFQSRVQPFFDFLYERWWRVEAHEIDRVPASGGVILCANHSGAMPYDGAMLATALRREHPTRRELRWLAEDFIFHFPFLGVFMNRIGAVRACQENAERLLKKSACVGVFPEGVKGISKLYRDKYRLQRFGRGGHVKLAIRTRTPIVPVAIVGAEETHPLIGPTGVLAKAMGLPFVPVTPTFPWLGPIGLVPLPSKWKMFFLHPIPMDGYAPEAAEDEVLVGRLNEKIRGLIQEELDRAVRDRQSVFKG